MVDSFLSSVLCDSILGCLIDWPQIAVLVYNLLMMFCIGINLTPQDAWRTTLLLRVKETLKAKELEEDDLT